MTPSQAPPRARVEGALIGLALGDAFNAPFEGGPIERIVWGLIGKTRHGKRRYTDDTQMALDLADCLLSNARLDLDDLATRFASHYRWSRGYGGGAARLLKRIRRGESWEEASLAIYPEGSFGNGGAMRAPVIGIWFATKGEDAITRAARDSARVTHAHELGMQGAVLMAHAVAQALAEHASPSSIIEASLAHCDHPELVKKVELARQWLTEHEAPPSHATIRKELGNGMTALTSCPTALYIACSHLSKSFEEMLLFARACKGDTDTIGSMAGAIWGAMHGVDALPDDWIAKLEDASLIREVAHKLHGAL